MARRVFFSFHYERDVRRIQQVRNSWVIRESGDATPFYDGADFEEVKRRAGGIERWIEEQLKGCSVTAVLYGRETASRQFVQYEVRRSAELGKGLLAIDIHDVRDPLKGIDLPGPNPLDVTVGGRRLSMHYHTYSWIRDDGYHNIGKWIERAAIQAGAR
jgi:hypothetical protein